MNTTSPQWLNGRGPNYDEMGFIHYTDAGMFTIRTFEHSLQKNGAREIRAIRIKTYTTGCGQAMKDRQSILT